MFRSLLVSFVFVAVQASRLCAHDLVVTVNGLRHERGRVLIGVATTKEAFPEKPTFRVVAEIDPASRTATARFADLPTGPIAVSVIHDENGNGRLDKNMVGIPTEPVGFSNGARPFFGPPSFASARVERTDGAQAITIGLGGAR